MRVCGYLAGRYVALRSEHTVKDYVAGWSSSVKFRDVICMTRDSVIATTIIHSRLVDDAKDLADV